MTPVREMASCGAADGSGTRPCGDDRLLDSCRQVEGLFISQLIAEMDRPAWGEGILGSSAASKVFAWQRNQALSEEMGRRGELGLADMLYRELSRSEQ